MVSLQPYIKLDPQCMDLCTGEVPRCGLQESGHGRQPGRSPSLGQVLGHHLVRSPAMNLMSEVHWSAEWCCLCGSPLTTKGKPLRGASPPWWSVFVVATSWSVHNGHLSFYIDRWLLSVSKFMLWVKDLCICYQLFIGNYIAFYMYILLFSPFNSFFKYKGNLKSFTSLYLKVVDFKGCGSSGQCGSVNWMLSRAPKDP